MKGRFAFFYFMKDAPEKIRDAAPRHSAYWKNLELDNYTGGPFTDRSGGLITFTAQDIIAATELTMNDPFVAEDLLKSKWIKEWAVTG
jgi:uncharacterized protein YciI